MEILVSIRNTVHSLLISVGIFNFFWNSYVNSFGTVNVNFVIGIIGQSLLISVELSISCGNSCGNVNGDVVIGITGVSGILTSQSKCSAAS